MFKTIQWQPLLLAALVLGAYIACRALKIDSPAWLSDAVAIVGMGIVASARSIFGAPTQTTTVTATVTKTEPKPSETPTLPEQKS